MTVKIVLNATTDISDFVKTVSYSGDSTKFNRQIDVDLIATENGRKSVVNVKEGDAVTFRYNDKLRFIGVVFSTEITSDGSMTFTAYDSNVYLSKSMDSRIFRKKKASDIIRILARDFGIPIGKIADTGYVIPYVRFENKSIFEMVLTVLTLTRRQTGKRYFVGSKAGRLTLIKGADNPQRYIIRDGENLISATYSRSIEDTITQVKVIGGKKGKETIVTAKHDGLRKRLGIMQALEVMDEKATASQVKQRAQTLLTEKSVIAEQFNVEALGVPEVDVGTCVYVVNEMTKLTRAFYVTSAEHTYSSEVHTMSLELTRTRELPDIDIDSGILKPEETDKSSAKKKTTKKGGGKK